MGYIYKIINKINNHCYIGQTIMNLEERWKQHKTKRSNCRYLKNAFQNYGIENFDFKLICICFDDDLNRFEIDYIKKYDSLVPNGYNLREGGDNGGKHNNETKLKISKTLKGRTDIIRGKSQLGKYHTEEIKNKIKNSLKCIKPNPEAIEKMKITIRQYSKDKRDEINNRISNAKKGKIKTSKTVEQYDLDGNLIYTFLSITDAANSIKVARSSISRCCECKYTNVKGYVWKYKF
jgi:group I intron endonuclease